GVEGPTLDGWKRLILLVRAISREADRERKFLGFGGIVCDPSCDCWCASRFAGRWITALENRNLFGQRIKNAAFHHQRCNMVQIEAVRDLHRWGPDPKISGP